MNEIKNKLRRSGVIWLIGGLMFVVIAVLMMIADADYIFHGEITDLNSVIENGEDMPYDKNSLSSTYVTYDLYMPLDAYGYEIYFPFIGSSSKTYNYAVVDESGMILSVKVKDKKIMEQLESLSGDKNDTMTVTGRLSKNDTDMTHFLKDNYSTFAQNENIELTQYVIDTTATRGHTAFLYCFGIVMGIVMLIIFISRVIKLRRR
ncbi:MAG: hypothetical protein J6I46_10210 [Ruminococcus sp.]|nr:hypothetical protein [Ruminococcus sp.]